MLWDIGRGLLLLMLGYAIVLLVTVLRELFVRGEEEIRRTHENGGRLGEFFTGATTGGQRESSSAVGHGVHARIDKVGTLRFVERSSLISRDL